MIKTNIKLRVTPEQSEAIQKICFANNTSEEKELKLDFLDAPYLFISNKDGDDTFTISQTDGYSERFLATLTPLTNDEIEGLKQ